MKTLGTILMAFGIFSTLLISIGLPVTATYTAIAFMLSAFSIIHASVGLVFGPIVGVVGGIMVSLGISVTGAFMVAGSNE